MDVINFGKYDHVTNLTGCCIRDLGTKLSHLSNLGSFYWQSRTFTGNKSITVMYISFFLGIHLEAIQFLEVDSQGKTQLLIVVWPNKTIVNAFFSISIKTQFPYSKGKQDVLHTHPSSRITILNIYTIRRNIHEEYRNIFANHWNMSQRTKQPTKQITRVEIKTTTTKCLPPVIILNTKIL